MVKAWKKRVLREKLRGFFSRSGPLEQNETSDPVQAALLGLDADERAVVVLREIEECSYEDIADALQCRLGQVKSLLFRARAKLQILLRPERAS